MAYEYDLEAEGAVLHSMLQREDLCEAAISVIGEHPRAFAYTPHSTIYQNIYELWAQGTPIDTVTVKRRLDTTLTPTGLTKTHVMEAFGMLPMWHNGPQDPTHTREHSRILLSAYVAREMDAVETERKALLKKGEAPDLVLKQTIDRYYELAGVSHDNQKSQSMGRSLESLATRVDKLKKGEISFITPGLPFLEPTFGGGFERGDFVAIGARPGCGKSAMAVNMAIGQAKAGYNVYFLSTEMTAESLACRAVCSEYNLSVWHASRGLLDAVDQHHFDRGCSEFLDLPLVINDRPGDPVEIRAAVKEHKRRHGLDVVIVDYLQNVRAGNRYGSGTREQEVSYISKSMKELAMELDIVVIVPTQLNRKLEERSKAERKPQLSDFRESGSIEQDCDIALLLHRDMDDAARIVEAEVNVAKYRNGATGIVPCRYIRYATKFTAL